MGNLLKKKKASERLTDPPQTLRYVVPNHLVPADTEAWQHPNRGYLTNHIKTTKYTIWSFLPKNLFEQFHRLANLYFVFIVLLNWVPVVNAIGKKIAMIPLMFVLSVTAIKDAFEDWRRFKSDKTINHQSCRIYSKTERRYVRCEWQDVMVGDIVHLSCNEVMPADMVLLRSSDEAGICHIDTANIDGENNLKQRNIIRGLKYQGSEFHPTLFTHTIECELPSLDIYKFHGALITSLNEKIPINNNNMLLRGCIVRNTDYVEAIVVYAGHETKALLNNRGPRYKRSKIERHINRDVLWCVIILFLMSFGCACGSGNWLNRFRDSTAVMYISYETLNQYSPVYQGVVRFWTFIILFQMMIPVSLYVTVELVKLGQVYFIHEDQELYHEPSNKSVECRALNITEDLGQVEYIFSDKTGTLTENKMIFKRCTIGGKEYTGPVVAEEDESGKLSPADTYNSPAQALTAKLVTEPIALDPVLKQDVAKMTLCEERRQQQQQGTDVEPLSQHTQTIHDFFLLLAVCNTVVVSAHERLDLMDAMGNIPDLDEYGGERPPPAPPSHSASGGPPGGARGGVHPSPNSTLPSSHHGPPYLTAGQATDASITAPEYSSIDRYTRLHNEPGASSSGADTTASATALAASSSSNLPKVERHYSRLQQEFGRSDSTASSSQALAGGGGSGAGSRNVTPTPGAPGGGGTQTPPVGTSSNTSSPRGSLKQQLRKKLPSIFNSRDSSGSGVWRCAVGGMGGGAGGGNEDDFPDDSDTEGASMMSENTLKMRYEAESPDELALVKAACSYGCRLVRRTPEYASIWLAGEGTSAVEIMHILPFDSFRKRMSVIVRHPVTKDIVLLCKGADTNIYACLKPTPDDPSQEEMRERTTAYLTEYAKLGLRTLCMAKRVLSNKEYEIWKLQHDAAENAMQGRDRLLHQSSCRIETDLILLGATGIEDRLQEHVPETIFSLREAGIKVWVLTGDKQETALNIAYSAKLFSFEQQLVILNAKSKSMAESLIRSKLEFVESLRDNPIIQGAKQGTTNLLPSATANTPSKPSSPVTSPSKVPAAPGAPISPSSSSSLTADDPNPSPRHPGAGSDPTKQFGSSSECAMVIDGKTLGFVLESTVEPNCLPGAGCGSGGGIGCDMGENEDLPSAFLRLAQSCSSVLCVRATPFQKAAMVKLVRDKLNKLTLAIGDGANDVSMIQTADVGLGLSGEEGMQAVMASDFSLARFCFLKRLLLVHGHWCYDRLARMTLYMWYKNAIFIFMLMWFQCFTGFSGGTYLDDWSMILFNLIFTSLPPILFGILEKDVEAEALMRKPKLYRQGPQDSVYKRYSYFMQIADAMWQSLIAFFVCYFVHVNTDTGMWEFGFTAHTSCVLAATLHLAIETRTWGPLKIGGTVLSIAAYYILNMMISKLCLTCSHPADPHYVGLHTLKDPRHWLAVVLSVLLALGPHFCIRVLQGTLSPSPVMRQRYKDHKGCGGASSYLLPSSLSATSNTAAKAGRIKAYRAMWKSSDRDASYIKPATVVESGSGFQTMEVEGVRIESGAARGGILIGVESDSEGGGGVRHRRGDSNGTRTTVDDSVI